MEASRVMSLEPRISRMGTDRKKAMLARPVLGQVGHLQRPLQASLRPPFQSPSSIRFANDLHRPNACRSSISQLLSSKAQSASWSSGAVRGATGAQGFRNPVQA